MDILVKANILKPSTGLQLKKAIGFRNIAVHNYEAINWDIVFSIISQHLQDFVSFSTEINAFMTSSA